jgi:hypothetical protein
VTSDSARNRVGALAFLAGLVAVPFARYPSIAGADWDTYRNGIAAVLDGRGLYRPDLALGSYDYLSAEFANAYNMPPWFAPVALPILAMPDVLERPAWILVTGLILVAAFALVMPLGDRVIWVALAASMSFAWMALTWGNASALVALGIAIWMAGLRRHAPWMEVAGIVVASIKIVPAIPLVVYHLQTRNVRPLLLAAAVLAGISGILMVWTGTNVVLEFAIAFSNIRQVSETNLAPASLLAPALPGLDLVFIVRILSLAALVWLAAQPPSLYRVAAMELVVCGLVSNVYAFWLLHPVIAALGAVRADEESIVEESTPESHEEASTTSRSLVG